MAMELAHTLCPPLDPHGMAAHGMVARAHVVDPKLRAGRRLPLPSLSVPEKMQRCSG